MTNYKQLCGELLNRLNGLYEEVIDAGVGCVPDEAQDLMNRAWDALSEPEPEGPTDEELEEEFGRALLKLPGDSMNATAVTFARAVLARWGRPAPQPVPVSERLPGPGDCDADGRCWWWDRYEGCWWYLKPISSEQALQSWSWTHWLPAHALPLPQPQ